MSEQTRRAAEQVAINDGFDLTLKASLWAFFVLHAIPFIRPGGRTGVAFSQSSFLFAEYATVVRNYVARHFKRSLIAQLQQRLFLSEGTEELTAVLLADGAVPTYLGSPARSHLLIYADTLVDLEKGHWGVGTRTGTSPPD